MSLTRCSSSGNSHQPCRPRRLILQCEAVLASVPLLAPHLVSLCICLTFISVAVLVFFHCVTNHHKLRGLLQHQVIISVSAGQEFWQNVTGCSVRGLTRLKSRVTWGCELIGGSGPLPSSPVVGRIPFLVVVKSLFSCWPVVGDHTQLPEATCTCLTCGLSTATVCVFESTRKISLMCLPVF